MLNVRGGDMYIWKLWPANCPSTFEIPIAGQRGLWDVICISLTLVARKSPFNICSPNFGPVGFVKSYVWSLLVVLFLLLLFVWCLVLVCFVVCWRSAGRGYVCWKVVARKSLFNIWPPNCGRVCFVSLFMYLSDISQIEPRIGASTFCDIVYVSLWF